MLHLQIKSRMALVTLSVTGASVEDPIHQIWHRDHCHGTLYQATDPMEITLDSTARLEFTPALSRRNSSHDSWDRHLHLD